MARRPVRLPYTSPDIAQLETDIRFQETIYKKVTSIVAEKEDEDDPNDPKVTIAVHDNRNRVPPNSLVLRLDPNGNVATPDGTTPLFKGKAIFGGTETAIAAFRKTA